MGITRNANEQYTKLETLISVFFEFQILTFIIKFVGAITKSCFRKQLLWAFGQNLEKHLQKGYFSTENAGSKNFALFKSVLLNLFLNYW